jgi:hypothetical protein
VWLRAETVPTQSDRMSIERVHATPDWMSFEDAAIITVVYLTALYGLYHLASLQEGQVSIDVPVFIIMQIVNAGVECPYTLRSGWRWACSNPACSIQEGRGESTFFKRVDLET